MNIWIFSGLNCAWKKSLNLSLLLRYYNPRGNSDSRWYSGYEKYGSEITFCSRHNRTATYSILTLKNITKTILLLSFVFSLCWCCSGAVCFTTTSVTLASLYELDMLLLFAKLRKCFTVLNINCRSLDDVRRSYNWKSAKSKI